VDVTYRFGSTQSGRRDPHHGVEFLNSFGTPVLATANGLVVTAGDDRQPTSPNGAWPITFYGPYSYFYGNLVVIEHETPAALRAIFPEMPGKIYTLYGHLSEIMVEVGQQVQARQQIGQVGMSGIAEGSHLHFEVRLGENTYESVRNPELWLAPHRDENGQALGALAGRFIDSYGNDLTKDSIVLQHLPDGPEGPSDFEITLLTYEEKALLGQAPWEESFAVGDIPPGLYRVSFPHFGLRQELVQVYPGQLTVVTFR
jgi:murein DD-endopeptidase MepM/ murein hydrolase activator NlpD